MWGKPWLVVLSVLVWVACGAWKQPNPYHCPGGSECPDPGGPCASSGECGAPTPVCNEEIMTCVECTENRHCRPGTLCDQNICVECQDNADCASGLCLADRTCVGVDEVAYVDAAAVPTNPCTKETPCAELGKALALTPAPKYIKATGMLVTDAALTINRSVIIYGDPGRTKIARSFPGEVLMLKGMVTPQIDLFDLEIEGNQGSGGKECVEISETASVTMTRVNVHGHGENGVHVAMSGKLVLIDSQVHDNRLDGVRALAGATLEIRRSRIYSNSSGANAGAGVAGVNATNTAMATIDSSVITANAGTSGGVSIAGPFSIRNSIISNNGDLSVTTSAGGLTLNPLAASALAQFEFNTVAENKSVSGVGLACILVSFVASNSIFTGNTVNNCTVSYSLFTSGATGTNKNGDPMFKNKIFSDPAFYRIGSGSAARDSADPAAMLAVDIDGEPRDDGRRDMGADEFK